MPGDIVRRGLTQGPCGRHPIAPFFRLAVETSRTGWNSSLTQDPQGIPKRWSPACQHWVQRLIEPPQAFPLSLTAHPWSNFSNPLFPHLFRPNPNRFFYGRDKDLAIADRTGFRGFDN